jgi:hypothetical protein
LADIENKRTAHSAGCVIGGITQTRTQSGDNSMTFQLL